MITCLDCNELETCSLGIGIEEFETSPVCEDFILSGNDPVNHPSHYTDGKIEVADYIADKHFDFFLGNAIKYISRAGKKDPTKHVEDLEKAKWYINYEIKMLKEAQKDAEKE